jgi:fructokinase
VKIGIDLGGTKIEIVAIAGDGSTLIRRRIPTPAGDYEATLEAVQALVTQAEEQLGRRGSIGIGTPGAIDAATGLLKNSNSTVLNGKPLHRDLERRLARDVRVENDANCLALSEAMDGAGARTSVVFGVILGTGVGGGVVVDRHIVRGRNRIAGEWGHNPLPWSESSEEPGPLCYCGKRGCIETFLSGPAFAREFESATGRSMTPREIVESAAQRNPEATAALARYEHRLARGLATVVNVLDPDTIVLGGGLSNIPRIYERVPELMKAYVFSNQLDLRIVPAAHGDSSGVRGAAWLT